MSENGGASFVVCPRGCLEEVYLVLHSFAWRISPLTGFRMKRVTTALRRAGWIDSNASLRCVSPARVSRRVPWHARLARASYIGMLGVKRKATLAAFALSLQPVLHYLFTL